jgi:glutamyl-tRNA synthetase
LYPCYETAEALLQQREDKRQKGLPPVYRQKKDGVVGSGPAHWRFRLAPEDMVWQDRIRGEVRYHTDHLSDPVLMREDGSVSYMLSSVVDDRDFGITDIIRGEDHVTNTAIQMQLFQALGASVPIFGHFPLMLDRDGKKFSKRSGSVTVRDLREEGLLPMAMLSVLEAVGSGRAPRLVSCPQDLVKDFLLETKIFGR